MDKKYIVVSVLFLTVFCGQILITKNSATKSHHKSIHKETAGGVTDSQKVPEKTHISKKHTKGEREIFRLFSNDLKIVFQHLNLGGTTRQQAQNKIFELNEQWSNVRLIFLEEIRKPLSPKDLDVRMAMVDYLKYRVGFDDSVLIEVENLIKEKIPSEFPTKQRAFATADKAELAGGLAAVDWERTRNSINALMDPLLIDLALSESYYGLISSGKSSVEALKYCKDINPRFEI